MWRSRFAEEQMLAVPAEAEVRAGTDELFRQHGIGRNISYNRRNRYRGLGLSDAKLGRCGTL